MTDKPLKPDNSLSSNSPLGPDNPLGIDDRHSPDNHLNTGNPFGAGNRLGSDDRFHRAVYVISVAAELTGMHPQTLRIYERKGLLEPARTESGRRRYSDADLARLQRIAELTDQGLNLAGVLRVFELERQVADLQAQIKDHQHENPHDTTT